MKIKMPTVNSDGRAGAPPEEEYEAAIPLSIVGRDSVVNRFYDERRAEAMVKEGFDPARARTAGYVVSERDDGSLIWLDGQHRGAAAVKAGWGDTPTRVTILKGLTKAEEAEWVLLLQEDRRPTGPADAHRLGVESGRDVDLLLDRVCRTHGLKADGASRDGHLAAVAQGRKIAEKDGGEVLDLVLGTLLEAYGRKAEAVDGALVAGMGLFWRRYEGLVDRPGLIKNLQTHGPATSLLGSARWARENNKKPVYWNVALVLVDIYNKRRRSGALLPL